VRLFRTGKPPGVSRVPIGISLQKLACDLWMIAAMVRLLRRHRYDVLHAVEEMVFPAAILHRFFGVRLVYDMDSSLSDQLTEKWTFLRPLRRMFEAIERRTVWRSSLVLAVCEDLAAKVRPWLGEKPVVVLPDVPMADGEDHPVEALRETGDGNVLGLYVGNLERYQGIDLLLESLALLQEVPGFRMVVIGGSGKSVRHYQQLARSLGLDHDRLQLVGARPVAQLGAYLRQADILVSPRTLGQNTPMKVYSYMQAGKAILATDIRSHTQALDASCAMLVEADPLAMARGFEALVRDPALRARLGQAARDKAEREYSLPAYQRKLRVAYAALQGG
jgi:glycosyltransferase involved in cell wall biosynthesis